ncbi:MAG: hypothetical protein H0T93_10205 [Chloroflexia bacterium]|nr:hypothetical protein [Chloroflexia bacterium]
MSVRTDKRGQHRSRLLACVLGLWLLFALSVAGFAQDGHGFTVTVDPLTSCSPTTPMTGTVTLIGLTTGYGFFVQLRGDGEILDGQAFEGHDGYRNGTYEWSLAGHDGTSHEVLELTFALHDGEGEVIRDETIAVNPDCRPLPSLASATPKLANPWPVTESPSSKGILASPASTSSPVSGVGSLPVAGAEEESRDDVRMVFGLTAATIIVLSALAVLDRRPEP